MTRNITVAVSDEIDKKMRELRDVNWSEIVRQSIINYVNERKTKDNRISDIEARLKTLEKRMDEHDSRN